MCKKFLVCEKCGNMVDLINDAGAPISCCGQEMKLMTANTSEGAGEKHLPKVTVKCKTVTVNVGEVDHPMTDAHRIEWVYLKTTQGGQFKALKAGDAPAAVFKLGDEKAVAAYAYCNLHGLWMTEI